MTDYSALIERVRGLTGPDREVDCEICLTLNYVSALGAEDGPPIDLRRADDESDWLDYELIENGRMVEYTDPAAELTASVDAALGLAERVLPGLGFGLAGGHLGIDATIWPSADMSRLFTGRAATLPLAIIIAVLAALQSEAASP